MDATPRRYLRRPYAWLVAVLAIVGLATVPTYGAGAGAGHAKPTIVLVHGDWADGSSWKPVTTSSFRRTRCAARPKTARTSRASSKRFKVRSCSPPTPTAASSPPTPPSD